MFCCERYAFALLGLRAARSRRLTAHVHTQARARRLPTPPWSLSVLVLIWAAPLAHRYLCVSTFREPFLKYSFRRKKCRFSHVGTWCGSSVRWQPSRPDQRQEWMHSNDHWQATVVPDIMRGSSAAHKTKLASQDQAGLTEMDALRPQTTTGRQLERPLAGITCEVCSVCVCM